MRSPRLPRRLLIRRVARGGSTNQPPPLPEPARIPESIRDLLAEPTWSVKSLLPPDIYRADDRQLKMTSDEAGKTSSSALKQEISRDKLYHLLRLSALPPPRTPEEEQKLLDSLHRHLHFVRAVQNVDTSKPSTWDTPRANPNDPVAQAVWKSDPTGEVEPLVTIRDETFEGIGEATVHLRDLWPTLLKEEKRGLNNAVRRRWKVNTNWDKDRYEHAMAEHKSIEESGNASQEDKMKPESELISLGEANAERKDWWIDVNRLGGGLESRKKGKYFFVRRESKNSKAANSLATAQQLEEHTDKPDTTGG